MGQNIKLHSNNVIQTKLMAYLIGGNKKKKSKLRVKKWLINNQLN